jgi:hypothetical protein
MRRIIDYSRQRGIKQIFGTVLRENRPMLKVCELFKFTGDRESPRSGGTSTHSGPLNVDRPGH